ncbi:MAG: T9SS type A sorting domain-containing protein [Crocinitomicaceae bacterium]
MKTILTLIFALVVLSTSKTFAQNYLYVEMTIVYPSASGMSDGSATANVVGNYPGNYTVYLQSNLQAYTAMNSISGLDSTTFMNHNYFEFTALEDGSNDTIALTNYSMNIFPLVEFFQYGATVNITLDSLVNTMDISSCNGVFAASSSIGASTNNVLNYSWRNSIVSNAPWTPLPGTPDSLFIDSLCAGQYIISQIMNSPSYLLGTIFWSAPIISNNNAYNVVVTSTPSSTSSCTSMATATVSGAAMPVQYYWDGSTTAGLQISSGLCPGIHTLTVIDANSDTVSTGFGVADSLNYFTNFNTSNAADTVIVLVENCTYNYNIPTDSVTLDNILAITQDTVAVTFSLWQGGVATTMTDTTYVNFTGALAWYIDITVYCYTKAMGGHIIKSLMRVNNTDLGENELTKIILIYPNPADHFILIEGNISEARFYNSLGQLVLTSKDQKIDVSGLAPGLYQVLIKPTGSEESFIKKLIVE